MVALLSRYYKPIPKPLSHIRPTRTTRHPDERRGNCKLTIQPSLHKTRDKVSILRRKVIHSQEDERDPVLRAQHSWDRARRFRHDRQRDRHSDEGVVRKTPWETQPAEYGVSHQRPRHLTLGAVRQVQSP